MRPQVYLEPPFPHSELIAFYLQTEEKAERVGFEPTRRLNTAYAISNRAPSANSDTSPGRRTGVYQKANLLLPIFSFRSSRLTVFTMLLTLPQDAVRGAGSHAPSSSGSHRRSDTSRPSSARGGLYPQDLLLRP